MNLKKKLKKNFKKRLNLLGEDLFRHEDYKILELVFYMNSQDCWKLFGHSNDNLEDVEILYSTLVNGLLDDGQLVVEHEKESDSFYILRFRCSYSDYARAVTEEELAKVVEMTERGHNFYKDNKSEINNLKVRDKWRIWKDLEKETEDFIYSLASEKVKQDYEDWNNSPKNPTNIMKERFRKLKRD